MNSHLRFQIRIWDQAVSNTTWYLTSDSKSRKFPIQLQIWIWSQILTWIIFVKHASTCIWITLIKYTGYIEFPFDGLYFTVASWGHVVYIFSFLHPLSIWGPLLNIWVPPLINWGTPLINWRPPLNIWGTPLSIWGPYLISGGPHLFTGGPT